MKNFNKSLRILNSKSGKKGLVKKNLDQSIYLLGVKWKMCEEKTFENH
ncbi:MAG: hypothetical protein HYU67_00905 [Flavobacteriia bacterium]|nr:hypothetical protein [Flavobacteriia bacterium]